MLCCSLLSTHHVVLYCANGQGCAVVTQSDFELCWAIYAALVAAGNDQCYSAARELFEPLVQPIGCGCFFAADRLNSFFWLNEASLFS